MPTYSQFVPVFSSVKIDGDKLRVLARKYDQFRIEEDKTAGTKTAIFSSSDGTERKRVELPKHEVQIPLLELENFEQRDLAEAAFLAPEASAIYPVATLRVACSKGTYIRALAEDVGAALGVPAMLVNLRRTRSGDFKLADAISLEQLEESIKA